MPIIYSKCYIGETNNLISISILRNFVFAISFNFIALSWALNNDFFIGLLLIFTNTAFSFIALMLYEFNIRVFGGGKLVLFYFFWIFLDMLSLNWELNFPWLITGNLLSNYIDLIQWYEYTGVIGGSIWVLLVNTLLVDFFIFGRRKTLTYIVCLTPILFSFLLSRKETYKNEKARKVVVIQPNIDPHYEKRSMPYILQMNKIANLIKLQKDSANFLVLPETTLEKLLINEISSTPYLPYFTSIVKHDTNFSVITGVNLNDRNQDNSIESFNSVISYSDKVTNIYHKNKFIPFIEKIPYTQYWNEKFKREVDLFFESSDFSNKVRDYSHCLANGDKLTTLVCYEGLFGEYASNLVNKSQTEVIIITSNEGWWNQTYFNKQFLDFVKLRSVENRKWIVKCSNTGISAVINPNGKIIDSIGYGKSGCLSSTVYLNSQITFYSKYGDWIGYAFLGALFLFYVIFFVAKMNQNINPIFYRSKISSGAADSKKS